MIDFAFQFKKWTGDRTEISEVKLTMNEKQKAIIGGL
ncbi:hypothetical protein SMU75_09015 [Streptococcus mutans N3209]|nr:hypothetical protein SMU75_09015 [Streptococcus mutans N3209]